MKIITMFFQGYNIEQITDILHKQSNRKCSKKEFTKRSEIKETVERELLKELHGKQY